MRGTQPEGARFKIMSFHRKTADFVGHLQRALFDMRHVIEGKPFRNVPMGEEWSRSN
jgi:hypothetical protein